MSGPREPWRSRSLGGFLHLRFHEGTPRHRRIAAPRPARDRDRTLAGKARIRARRERVA